MSKEDADEFYVGQELSWYHGDTLRIARVESVEFSSVTLSGMTCDYRMSKATLKRKLERSRRTRASVGGMGAYSC